MSPSNQMEPTDSLRILSLNCWGLLWVSKNRQERLNAIGDYLAASGSSPANSDISASSDMPLNVQGPSSQYDIVCLQEGERGRPTLFPEVSFVRPYIASVVSVLMMGRGALGSGLMILSRFPIIQSRIYRYPLNGAPLRVIEGDWYVGKAAASAVIDLGAAGIAEVFCTHFYSSGDQWPDEWRRAHRLSQAWELAQLANNAAEKGRHVFVCGDLNSTPSSLVIQLMAAQGSLHDAWALTQGTPNPNPSTPAESLRVNGMTCDSPLNSFSANKQIWGQAKDEFGKRLDYIFFRPSQLAKTSIRPISTQVTFTERVPSQEFSYSDHFGIEAAFAFPHAQEATALPEVPSMARAQLEQIIAGMHQYAKHAARESRVHLYIFSACLAFGLVVLPIAASFQPLQYLNWIFTYLGVATGVLGATMLYVGFVGGRWEQGGLQNIIDEMEVELVRLQQR